MSNINTSCMDVFKISDVTSAKNVSLDELQGYIFPSIITIKFRSRFHSQVNFKHKFMKGAS